MLFASSNFMYIDLSSGAIDADSGISFISALKQVGGASALQKLYLQANTLLNAAFIASLSGGDVQLQKLQKLHLQCCTAMGDAGAGAVANALRSAIWPQLSELNLSSCDLSDDGAVAISVAIRHVGAIPKLRELNLSGNEIGDIGAVAIAGALFGPDELLKAEKPAQAAKPEGEEEAVATGAEDVPAADEAAAVAAAEAEGGGGEAAGASEELPAPELEEVLLGGNRIGHDGLGAVFEAISVDGSLERCPKLRALDVRGQRGLLAGAVGSGKAAADVKKSAEAAAAKVTVAMARVAAEASTASKAWLDAMGTSDEEAAREGKEEEAKEEAPAEEAPAEEAPAEEAGEDGAPADAPAEGEAEGDKEAAAVDDAAAAAEKYWAEAAKIREKKAAEREARLQAAAEQKAKEAAEQEARKAIEEEAEAIEKLKADALAAEKELAVAAEAEEKAMAAKAEADAKMAEAAKAAEEEARATGGEEEASAEAPAAVTDAAPPAAAAAAEVSSGALRIQPADLKLGRSIAAGAEAEVFRGLLWGQKAAIKVLKSVRDTGEEKAAETIAKELKHETQLLAKMSHPSILSLIGYTNEPAQIVLEALDGTAYDLISSGSIEQCDGKLLGPLSDVLSGCAYLHALATPVIHRDLKPPNILYDERFRCKLCDFGTALELRPSDAPPTEWMGSALYVAPEVDRQEPYGLPADVFSFGVLAYELYFQYSTGYNFYGEADGGLFDEVGGLLQGLELVRGPLTSEPQELPERPEYCESDAVWDLIMRCCKLSPDERPTFAMVAKEIGDIRQEDAADALAGWL